MTYNNVRHCATRIPVSLMGEAWDNIIADVSVRALLFDPKDGRPLY